MYRININIADVWAEPKYDSERVTQALFNERVEVLDSGKEYSLVRLEDNYQGYIDNNFFSEDNSQVDNDFIISASFAVAYLDADHSASAVTLLPFLSTVKAQGSQNNFTSCETSRYGKIFLDHDDLIPITQKPKLTLDMTDIFIKSIKRFIGVPFLWGGKSFFGFDCSGLIQANLSFFNFGFPRDTKDQINIGKEIPRNGIKPGDLLYFDRHVGLAVTDKQFVHSSLSQGGVCLSSLNSGDANYLKHFDDTLKIVRRIIED